MRSIKVFKIGGSVLTRPSDFQRIAKRLTQQYKSKICIVTSAMKGLTTKLIDTFFAAVPKPDFWEFEGFVGLGEIQSALLFTSAFNALDIRAISILPWMKEWPLRISLKDTQIMSREKINEKRNFRVLKRSYTYAEKFIKPLFMNHRVVIFPGFIARDSKGRTVTLGRGGSDISALLFSELLGVRELVLIKEIDGVLDLDPRLHHQATKISTLDAGELGLIASSGAQVLHPISLKHQNTLRRIKVTSLDTDIDRASGTRIDFQKRITVHRSRFVYSVLTFVGEKIPETPGLLKRVSSVLANQGISIYSITVSDNLITLYVDQARGEEAYRLLSPIVKTEKYLKSLNLKRNIGKVLVRSLKFINEPGVIKKIVTPIAKHGINIWEVLTAHTDVMVFVEHSDISRTYSIITKIFSKKTKTP